MVNQLRTEHGSDQTLNDAALAHLVGYATVKANLVLGRAFQKSIGQPMDLRPIEFTLLTLLADDHRATQKDLAAQLMVRAPNLTVILNRLAQRKLVTIERNASDGRSVLIGLSRAGKRLQAAAYEISLSMEAPALARLNRNEKNALLRLLDKVTSKSNT